MISEYSSSVMVGNNVKLIIVVSQWYDCLQKNSSQNSSRNPQRVRFLNYITCACNGICKYYI